MNSTFAYKTLLMGILVILVAVTFKQLLQDESGQKKVLWHTKKAISIQPTKPVPVEPAAKLKKKREKPVKLEKKTVKPQEKPKTTTHIAKPVQKKKTKQKDTRPVVKSKFKTEWKGTYSGITKPVQRIIKDNNEWKTFWNKFISNRQERTLLPEIDFSRKMVLVIAMGNQPTSGYGVAIRSIALKGKTMVVYYSEQLPDSSKKVSGTIPCQPYHVKVIRSNHAESKFVKTR